MSQLYNSLSILKCVTMTQASICSLRCIYVANMATTIEIMAEAKMPIVGPEN